jgi:hypothetical protein
VGIAEVVSVAKSEQVIGHGLYSVEVMDVALEEGNSGDWSGCHLRGKGSDAVLLALGHGAQLRPVAIEDGECPSAPAVLDRARSSTGGDWRHCRRRCIKSGMEAVDDESLQRNVGPAETCCEEPTLVDGILTRCSDHHEGGGGFSEQFAYPLCPAANPGFHSLESS